MSESDRYEKILNMDNNFMKLNNWKPIKDKYKAIL